MLSISQMGSDIYRKQEESAKKALALKKNELKWKLLQASQMRNSTKLDEIKFEAACAKKRSKKISSLLERLKAKYMKACKAAYNAEASYKSLEEKFSAQEKFVAEEKMQLTRLELECKKLGFELYGQDYKLSTALDVMTKPLNPDGSHRNHTETRMSSLYDFKDSLLRNLSAYRLSRAYQENNGKLTDLMYAHNICPSETVCAQELDNTSCNDKNCSCQHEQNYLMTDVEKLADIISYKPSICGVQMDPNQPDSMDLDKCRLRMKQYAARLLAQNSTKGAEVIAQSLIMLIRADKNDVDLLFSERVIPRMDRKSTISNDQPQKEPSTSPEQQQSNESSPGQENSLNESDDDCQVVIFSDSSNCRLTSPLSPDKDLIFV